MHSNAQVATWIERSRVWAAQASAQAGAPPPLQLLPSAPLQQNPAWRRAPSWAAAALLVPLGAKDDAGSSSSSSSQQHVPSSAELAAAAALARDAGLLGRAMWVLGGRDSFFMYANPYPHYRGMPYRQRDLLPATLAVMSARDAGSGGGGGDVAARQAQRAQQQAASALFYEVAADQSPTGLRLVGWLLAQLFGWLFNSELYVDAASLSRLRTLYHGTGAGSGGCGAAGAPEQRQEGKHQEQQQGQQGDQQPGDQAVATRRACMVYIPAHKSHLDYLLLSYVLFASGLPCPHIAGGANLSLPLVGRVLRVCGAFFIRRTSRGTPDSHLYKAVLAAYVHALLVSGHSLEFFIEGGRSRDGRVNSPKLGLLKMVVEAVEAGDVGWPVYLVPTAMNYDAVPEEDSLAAQLAGAAKRSESLAGLASTCWSIAVKTLHSRWQRHALGLGAGGYCGRATVAFGQPICLQQWLGEQREVLAAGGGAARHAVAQLGERVTAGIRTASVLPTAALLVGALFAEQHCPTVPGQLPNGNHGNGISGTKGSKGGQTSEQPRHSVVASNSSSEEGSGTPAPAALASMDWLAGELEQRGAAVLRLPRASPADGSGSGSNSSVGGISGSGEAQGEQQEKKKKKWQQQQQRLLLHVASMLPACCSTTPGTSSGQPALLHLQAGIKPSLLQHSRLNQLLPWLAGEGLVVAAVLAAGDGQTPCASKGASRAAVLEGAAWLRCLLAPEIDTAVGPAALRSMHEFEPLLQRLLASGALEQQPGGALRLAPASSSSSDSSCSSSNTFSSSSSGGSTSGSRRAAVLSASLLAPHLSSYCEALRGMLAALAAAGPGGLTQKELCSAAQKRLLALAAGGTGGGGGGGERTRTAALLVPSTALVQGALRSLSLMGVLQPASLTNGADGSAHASSEEAEEEEEEGEDGKGSSSLQPASRRSAGSSRSADDEKSGGAAAAAEEEGYHAEPSTPAPTPATSTLSLKEAAAAATAAGAVEEGAAASGGSGGAPGLGRRSMERQRRRRQQQRQAAAVGGGSSDDSELDPTADSVAAHLCRLDGSTDSPPRVMPAAAPAAVVQEAGQEASVVTAAAAAATVPAALVSAVATPAVVTGGSSQQVPGGKLVLAQPGQMVQQLADRIESFICI